MPLKSHRSAFEVCFPGETQIPESQVASGSGSRKRPGEPLDHGRKRTQRTGPVFYEHADGTPSEATGFELEGEVRAPGDKEKPIRTLSGFCVYDPAKRSQLASLAAITESEEGDEEEEQETSLMAAGWVRAVADVDEDEGQDDDEEQQQGVYAEIGPLQSTFYEAKRRDGLFFVQTEQAWYILTDPSDDYRDLYLDEFYLPRFCAQLVISRALEDSGLSWNTLKSTIGSVEALDQRLRPEDVLNATAICNLDASDFREVIGARLITDLIPNAGQLQRRETTRKPSRWDNERNLDLAVLRPENQTTTSVIPLMAQLAEGRLTEPVNIIGRRGGRGGLPDDAFFERHHEREMQMIQMLRRQSAQKYFRFEGNRADPRPKSLIVEDRAGKTRYSVGDTIVLMKYESLPEIQPGHHLCDLFWFATIVYIDRTSEQVHIRWFEAAPSSWLDEIAHPQELFLTALCDPKSPREILGRIEVHWSESSAPIGEYFCRYSFDKNVASLTDVERPTLEGTDCSACQAYLDKEAEADVYPRRFRTKQLFIEFGGHAYHKYDYCLYRAKDGPALIGQIRHFEEPGHGDSMHVRIRPLGRYAEIVDLPRFELRDERHLFLTTEAFITLDATNLVHPCMVAHADQAQAIPGWLDDPYHFYVKYTLPNRKSRWNQRVPLAKPEDVPACKICVDAAAATYKAIDRPFNRHIEKRKLRVLDVFGGVGAFSMGLAEGSRCMKLTHLIEKSPSAAKTVMANFPGVQVYNQCANTVLEYMVKRHDRVTLPNGDQIPAPLQIYDANVACPPPIRPGDIDVVVAGFPCQSHSLLNRFRRIGDKKNNLIWNALSWVGFLKPKYVFFENVPGFLQYNLLPRQVSPNRLAGGIEKGGLKLCVRALAEMGYQSRFCLMQAGHYGAPQHRVRFFVVAAKQGLPLPDLPQPTHDFTTIAKQYERLTLVLSKNTDTTIRPINTENGVAPFKAVTVADAIDDLKRFHWTHPKRPPPNDGAPVVTCNTHSLWGYEGADLYEHVETTTFQRESRCRPSENLQHFTRRLPLQNVERVLAIPQGGDSRHLPRDLHYFTPSNPISATGRGGYKTVYYGRLHPDGFFPAITTNIGPTAKQGRVLHYSCGRIVTVRELARAQGFPDWFIFERLEEDDILTIHRQIGNAVPLPLGRALGRELRRAVMDGWRREQERRMANEQVIDLTDEAA
ncbi:S-adenosyl-L-methionine-dependent methyltransferase [Schizophyllum commune]